MNRFMKKARRIIAGTLAAFILLSSALSDFPVFNANAYTPGETMLSGSAKWKFYCIDSYELLGEAGGVQGTNEWYAYVVPSTRLSSEETAILFWATLSMLAGKGDTKCKAVLDNINNNAAGVGLPKINSKVTEDHLKKLIHSEGMRDKYPWLKTVVANADKYLKMAGLLGSSGGNTSSGGKTIPAVLQGHDDASNALTVDKSSFTIQFDPSGADKDFIQKVPLGFSTTGGDPWESSPFGGWTYQKTDSNIIFSNPNPTPPKMIIKFETKGTEYQVGKGFSSVQEAYDTALQLWVCIECNDRHTQHSQKKLPLEAHQRLVNLVLDDIPKTYYAAIAGDPVPNAPSGGIKFQVYRHEEEMESTYNLQMKKYDYETGIPLENSVFKLYERFDDKDEIDRDRDGAVHIYEGGEPFKSYHKDNPVIWNDFKFVSGLTTDGTGYASKTINHGYHYDKTFCDGHPAPVFVRVPEEEEDEETGEITNKDEIEAAQAENKQLAQAWINCFASCESYAAGDFDGVHFHWLMSDVDQGEIERVSSSGGSPGDTPSAGKTTSASETEAFEQSGCREDAEETYDKFISLRYSYALVESKARPGYIRHDLHADDLPIEVITTDSSENGANARFAQEYSKDITTNDKIKFSLASETLEARQRIASYQLPEVEASEEIRLEKEKKNYVQEILQFFLPEELMKDDPEEEETTDEVELVDDVTATPSNTKRKLSKGTATEREGVSVLATDSNSALATPSELRFSRIYDGKSRSSDKSDQSARSSSSSLFTDAYNTALSKASSGADVTPGPDDHYSHCNDCDREDNTWRIYDHRTEGQIHINKRDKELKEGETGGYDSYGDSQGDATLEGAVYGLYAAADILHPDGKTGTVFEANNLVAVATTDRNGDASFLAITEVPGKIYDYDTGMIVKTTNGWSEAAPRNLYVSNSSYDDYTVDGTYERTYVDNETNNGNCWIGRPLLMGSYYVKELSRSEGFELSIGNKDNVLTNKNQNTDMTLPTGTGYVNTTRSLYAEGQISSDPTGEFGNPDIDELFFGAESKGTGESGFDVVLKKLPIGARFYRLDTGKKTVEVQVGTGVYDKIYLTNADGTPKYAVAGNDYQYPKYNADGSLMTMESSVNYRANLVRIVEEKPVDLTKAKQAVEADEPSMTKDQVAAKLAAAFSQADVYFLKGKVERALRANGKGTPKVDLNGKPDYSSIYAGIYDEGVREGEPDSYGVSGVTPGEPAARTVYGSPVVTLEISKEKGGSSLKIGEAILSVLDFFNTNGFYSYGGVHAVEEASDKFLITVYASSYGNPEHFMVQGSDRESDSVVYRRVSYLPMHTSERPRYVYATYSNNPAADAFGTYEDYSGLTIGGTDFGSATLITDVTMDEQGNLISKTMKQNVYYRTGDTPKDEHGNPIREFEYREQTVKTTQEVEVSEWTELPAREVDGVMVAHIDSSYTDRYGGGHQDRDLQSYFFRVVLPRREIALTQTDIDQMQITSGWFAGEKMGSASYYLKVQRASAEAYLNYADLSIMGDSSYVQRVDLVYQGQEFVWQDGESIPGTNTRVLPVPLQERAIKQQIKVKKKIERYTDRDAGWMGNFRFKVYLKSNLEGLYRDEAGDVVWLDRNGNVVDVAAYRAAFPKEVQKLYTKVPHTADLFRNSKDAIVTNTELYSFTNGFIHTGQNSGFTRMLETVTENVTDKNGTVHQLEVYNYEKFFAAIRTVDTDKWHNKGTVANTSFKPFPVTGNQINTSEIARANALSSDAVRQFAIDWYLEEEVKKLVQNNAAGEQESAGGNISYSEAVYDRALHEALKKADNYLKPFFSYDLDTIYSIKWDSETKGGKDGDVTTLSVDTFYEDGAASYCYGVSRYLPYGTYVLVEEQPEHANLNDFPNKHYEIGKPRELVLPSLYEPGELEAHNRRYIYDSSKTPDQLSAAYGIRFNEEWTAGESGNQNRYVIQAHNNDGDFKIFKYGLDLDKILQNFRLSQEKYNPTKTYYHFLPDGSNDYYLPNRNVSEYYRYASVSEQAGNSDGVVFSEADGVTVRDHVKIMEGTQIAYEGKYAHGLVPWTVTEPAGSGVYDPEEFYGYADCRFVNRFYKARLRIEKLDSETGENLLHDEAIFAVYAATREDSSDGDGNVLFYESPTLVTGSREFLEAMGAYDIRTKARDILDPDDLEQAKCYGTVPAGTPICQEGDRIILNDSAGNKTGDFHSFSTKRDGFMRSEDGSGQMTGDQNVGYLETPRPIGAGVYVLAEIKPPAGYARSKPIAVEVYSDQIGYYLDGDRDRRVAAAVYDSSGSPNVSDTGDKARIYVGNTPIRLEVSKRKTERETVTYRVSGRVEGSITELKGSYGLENLELAYTGAGVYLGYGWQKGTAEYLAARKEAGEDVIFHYEKGVFSGYADVTRQLDTKDDTNRSVHGATLTLYDALEVRANGGSQDFAYDGLVVERDKNGNVSRMYVEAGYAGSRIEFLQTENQDGWDYRTVRREDTDILFYDLGGVEGAGDRPVGCHVLL